MVMSGGRQTSNPACITTVAGDRVVPEYRLYTIKSHGHLDGPPRVVDCPDDTAVLAEAKQQMGSLDIEIWQGSRVVAFLVPDRKPGRRKAS
jgi:hypothetical protein